MNIKKIIVFSVIIIICISAVCATYILTQPTETKINISCNSTLYNGDNILFQLTEEDGNPLSNKTLNITIIDSNGRKNTLNLDTDKNGSCNYILDNVSSGKCTVECVYSGSNGYCSSKNIKTINIEEVVTEVDNDYYKDDSYSTEGTPININGDTSGKQYYLVEYPYQGMMESGLVRDNYGNYYVYAGDGLHPLSEW